MLTTRFASPGDEAAQALVLQPRRKDRRRRLGARRLAEGRTSRSPATSLNGVLDPTFGDGKVTTTSAARATTPTAPSSRPDGKIVVGRLQLPGQRPAASRSPGTSPTARSIQASLGRRRVMTDVGPDGTAWAVALQRDGKIVAARHGSGTSSRSPATTRTARSTQASTASGKPTTEF